MKSIIGLVFFGLFLNPAFGGDSLPSWIEKDCKIYSFENLVEWTQKEPFYRITQVKSDEVTIPSGQRASLIQIIFDDSEGCQNRELESTCTPVGLDTPEPVLMIQSAMTACAGQNLEKRYTKFLSKQSLDQRTQIEALY